MLQQGVRSPQSVVPRKPLDPCTRKAIFGPVRPMEHPGLFRRLFGA